MSEQLPPGQPPVDPRGAFSPPPPPSGTGWTPPTNPPQRPNMPPVPPPQMMYPPPMYYPQPPKEKSFARAIFMTLATTIFGLSIFLNIYLLAFSGLMAGGMTRHKTLVDGDPNQLVAIVPINGVIMGKSYQNFEKLMSRVDKDPNVKAVVIEIDSPGGTVTASDEIYNRIRLYRNEHPNIPVVVSMRALAASGGYYIACASDTIFAEPTTITGSIGVLLQKVNVSKLMDKWGVEDTSQKSSGADFKDAGSSMKPELERDRQYFQGIIDDAFSQFKGIVASSRGKKLTSTIDEIANGKIYTSTTAANLGLIDRIGYPIDAAKFAISQAKLAKPTVIRYEDSSSLMDLLGSEANVGSLPTSSGQNINLNVNIDIAELLRQRASLMYLYDGN